MRKPPNVPPRRAELALKHAARGQKHTEETIARLAREHNMTPESVRAILAKRTRGR